MNQHPEGPDRRGSPLRGGFLRTHSAAGCIAAVYIRYHFGGLVWAIRQHNLTRSHPALATTQKPKRWLRQIPLGKGKTDALYAYRKSAT
jgi:hypothetical protein